MMMGTGTSNWMSCADVVLNGKQELTSGNRVLCRKISNSPIMIVIMVMMMIIIGIDADDTTYGCAADSFPLRKLILFRSTIFKPYLHQNTSRHPSVQLWVKRS